MNLARNTCNRTTARPPRDIRGCFEHLSRTHRDNHLALWAIALLLFTPAIAVCQVGQTPMQSSDGLVNRAVQGIGNLNAGGAGRMYYGVNGADRGLGYRGSYMTLGGFFPALEDDYGGLWAADTRGHFSNYAGFFANIGAVRKQLLSGGSLLGFGLFWDYDGDQNQFPDQIIGDVDPMTFAGGYAYNQVGVSGELLTDWGNIRSNGYIPVGTTGQSTGKYVSRNILCMQGINAALGGADFELGAYLPGLADWAGMINVGGYTYGNTRYQLDNGADLVPWFGGVYTRLDMTFANNWDFSLQYNNDSYFDSTGFARLTYRLGGSRRRNVPDQMEQPMMRNEHIVRAHKNAVVATNPVTRLPWRVIHVDNNTTSPATGNGSITNPVASLGGAAGNPNAETIATDQFDIILVHSSTIPYSNIPRLPGSTSMFSFQESNQFLIGDGSAQTIPTVECGDLLVSTSVNPSLYPTISPQAGDTGILIAPNRFNETVSGFDIRVSEIGIDGQSATGTNIFNDLTLNGGITGIKIEGGANYDMSDDIAFSDQTGTGLMNDGTGEITITNTTFSNISGTAIVTNSGIIRATSVAISDTQGDGIIVGNVANLNPPPALLPAPLLEMNSSIITDSQQAGVIITGNGSIELNNTQIAGSGTNGILATSASTGAINLNSSIINGTLAGGGTSQHGIFVQGTTGVTTTDTIISSVVDGIEVTGNARLEMTGGAIRSITNDGIILAPTAPGVTLDGSARLEKVAISSIGDNGIQTIGKGVGGDVSFIDSSMIFIGEVGILASEVGNPTSGTGASVNVQNSSFRGIANTGIQVTDSNLRVNNTTFANTGDFGINSINKSTVFVGDSNFSGTTVTGIQATANNTLSFNSGASTGEFNYLTARDNNIATATNGIVLQGAIRPGGTGSVITSQGIVRSNITQNNISATNAISLTTLDGLAGTAATTTTPAAAPAVVGGLTAGNGRPQGIVVVATGRTNLQSLNNGATVTESPAAVDPETTTTSVDYDPTIFMQVPPQ